MSKTRIYVVRETGSVGAAGLRLIDATSAATAIRHCTLDRFSAKPAKPRDVAELMAKGVKIEQAKPEQQSIPLGEQG